MANFIVFIILCLILMLSSGNPFILLTGVVILIFIISGFNPSVFPAIFGIIIMSIVAYVIYAITKNAQGKELRKQETNIEEERKIIGELDRSLEETRKRNTINYEYPKEEIRENMKISEENEIIENLVNDNTILLDYINCCNSFDKYKELNFKTLKIEECLLKTISKIYTRYKYEIKAVNLNSYDKNVFMRKKFLNIDMIKDILENCFDIELNDLKEDNIFVNKLISENHFYGTYEVSNIIRMYKNNYAIWSINEKNTNYYILIYFCSYLFAKYLYENSEHANYRNEKNKYIIDYLQYMKMKKTDRESIAEQKEVIVVFNIEESEFEGKNNDDKLNFLVEKANEVRVQLKINEKLLNNGYMSTEDKEYQAIQYIPINQIINIIISSLRHYNINLEENMKLIVTNIINIFDKEEEWKRAEENKIEERKRIQKEKERLEREQRLEKERLQAIENKKRLDEQKRLKKEKLEQEKIKQKKLKELEIEKNKQKLLAKLEDGKDKINKELIKIFENISLFIIHSKNILDLKKDTNLYITILKRIILEIPPQFNNGTIKELKGETKKKILKEFELKKDLCLFIYNEIIEVLNHNLILNEVGNFKNCKELFGIYVSLTNTIDNEEYITDKIYTMYKNFYAKIFANKMSKQNIRELIQSVDKQNKYEMYKEEFLNKNKEYISNILDINEKSLTKFINTIEKTSYFKELKKIEIEEFSFVLNSIIYNKSIEEKVFILESLPKIYEKLNKDLNKKKLIEEKDRLLKGDMSKEIELQKLELDFSKIQNGYEFEEYVANLYEKLGYKIEEITKKSGDQRCRRNC